MSKEHIYFITGASGAGKTTLVSELKAKYADRVDWVFHHFDSIGVPSTEEMTAQFGSPANWQRAKTFEWVDRLLPKYEGKHIVIFEGQVNLDYIKEAFASYDFTDYTTILIDCSDDIMVQRLTHDREQPELVNYDMKNWFRFLREQAKKSGAPIIDTSNLTKEQMVEEFEHHLK